MTSESERLRISARSLGLLDNTYRRARGLPVIEHPAFDLAGLLGVLNRHDVRYVVIGGIAMRRVVPVRLTDDLDICYARDRANCRQLARALRELHARLRDVPTSTPLTESRLAHATAEFFLLTTDLGWLDLIPVPNGTTGFDDLVASAVPDTFDDIPVRVAPREDLLRMKRAMNRADDQRDIAWLEEDVE